MLVILRGPTLSGKTSVVESLLEPSAILSVERIRGMLTGVYSSRFLDKKVFKYIKDMLKSRLSVKAQFTVIDASNLRYRDVKEYIEIAKYYHCDYRILHFDSPSLHELKKRNIMRCNEIGVLTDDHKIEQHYNSYHNNLGTFIEKEKERNVIIDETYSFLNFIDSIELDATITNESVWCIGDVHGCGDEFEEILSEIRFRDREARIISLGDLIDRGPDLERIFELVDEYNVELIMGNHEYKFLREVLYGDECRSLERKKTIETFNALPKNTQDDILETINNATLYKAVYTNKEGEDEKLFLLSHAGKSDNESSCNIFTFAMNSDTVLPSEDGIQVFGHRYKNYVDIEKQIGYGSRTLNIDSGCVYGDKLTAIHLNTLNIIQVQAKAAYYTYTPRNTSK